MSKFFQVTFVAFVSIFLFTGLRLTAQTNPPDFSVAGFFQLADCGREVASANPDWRFIKQDVPGAEKASFDDSKWLPVNLPHGLELLPANASGDINYQGPAWYRTHIKIPADWRGKHITLYFEAVMGKAKVWIDGQPVAEHFGGYLPIVIDGTKFFRPGKTSVVAVRADNSDDASYPPGKPQHLLDFCYFGGIYRDAWLIASDAVHITDANQSDTVAGGGVFVHCDAAATNAAALTVRTEVENSSAKNQNVILKMFLRDPASNVVAQVESTEAIAPGTRHTFENKLSVVSPSLWTPDSPQLYSLELRLVSADGKPLDGGSVATGLRTLEFRGRDGLWLNGQPFCEKLIGGNRHQDYGYLGCALPDSLHWRDAALMRGAGLRVVRCHYPQAAAFMDACDRLGIFVIVSTPGWQFWNDKDPLFEQRVYNDVHDMVRRDRNHTSVFLWEAILNETRYPAYFPANTHKIVHAEYPFPGAYTAGDGGVAGDGVLDVHYGGPPINANAESKSVFRREWGDNVDSWQTQNSDARLARGLGETAQLVQAKHLLCPDDNSPWSYDGLCRGTTQFVGGCQWASFDHQRGGFYEPFWGGLWDVFRQPKYSRYAFASQRNPAVNIPGADSGPMIFAAHEMSPFSSSNITVFCNCEEVRMTAFNQPPVTQRIECTGGLPHPPIVFTNVFGFMEIKSLMRDGKTKDAKICFDGLIGGKVVVSQTIYASKAPGRIELKLADQGVPLVADGSDIMPLVATILDSGGNPKHFRNDDLVFTVTGEGRLVGDAEIGANPCRTEFGTAPLLIRSTGRAGQIVVEARLKFNGAMTMKPGRLVFFSVPPRTQLIQPPANQVDNAAAEISAFSSSYKNDTRSAGEVFKQQAAFENIPAKH
jgi:beta-galactosidase